MGKTWYMTYVITFSEGVGQHIAGTVTMEHPFEVLSRLRASGKKIDLIAWQEMTPDDWMAFEKYGKTSEALRANKF